jgi:hypothetical protein
MVFDSKSTCELNDNHSQLKVKKNPLHILSKLALRPKFTAEKGKAGACVAANAPFAAQTPG